MLENQKLIPFHELDLPATLYKYRKWGGKKFRTILTSTELKFSMPLDMDSVSELNYRVEPLRGSELFDFLKNRIATQFPFKSRDELSNIAISMYSSSIYHDEKRVQKEVSDLILKDYNNKFGVLCLSENKTNSHMWNYFASTGTGFCVGINTKKLVTYVLSGGGNMQYYKPNEEPVFRFPSMELENYSADMLNIILNLPEHFRPEGEYRIIKPFPGNVKVAKDAITEVIIGYAMKAESKKELIKVVSDNLPHALILTSEFDPVNNTITASRLIT